jgi:hypothetical protein
MKEKDQVGAHIYIEDAPKNIEDLRERNFYTICFVNSTNEHVAPPRAKNWEQVYDLVKTWSEEHNAYIKLDEEGAQIMSIPIVSPASSASL